MNIIRKLNQKHPGNPLFSYRVGRKMGCSRLRSIYIAYRMMGARWPIL